MAKGQSTRENMKTIKTLGALAVVLLAATGCTRMGGGTTTQARIYTPPPATSMPQTLPESDMPDQQTAEPSEPIQQASLNPGNYAFLDATALPLMSSQARSAATDAQFYALQFGRPGAPRQWQGGSGTSGQVTVGPYVRVNNLDCREFTHRATVNGETYSKSGTACREADGSWDVVDA